MPILLGFLLLLPLVSPSALQAQGSIRLQLTEQAVTALPDSLTTIAGAVATPGCRLVWSEGRPQLLYDSRQGGVLSRIDKRIVGARCTPAGFEVVDESGLLIRHPGNLSERLFDTRGSTVVQALFAGDWIISTVGPDIQSHSDR